MLGEKNKSYMMCLYSRMFQCKSNPLLHTVSTQKDVTLLVLNNTLQNEIFW